MAEPGGEQGNGAPISLREGGGRFGRRALLKGSLGATALALVTALGIKKESDANAPMTLTIGDLYSSDANRMKTFVAKRTPLVITDTQLIRGHVLGIKLEPNSLAGINTLGTNTTNEYTIHGAGGNDAIGEIVVRHSPTEHFVQAGPINTHIGQAGNTLQDGEYTIKGHIVMEPNTDPKTNGSLPQRFVIQADTITPALKQK